MERKRQKRVFLWTNDAKSVPLVKRRVRFGKKLSDAKARAVDVESDCSSLLTTEDHRVFDILGPSRTCANQLLFLSEAARPWRRSPRLAKGSSKTWSGYVPAKGYVAWVDDEADLTSDAACWDALRRSGLEAKARQLGGLEAGVAEAGGNLSAGERQLLCMARALLRRASILVMDEATASVDHATDARIQQMVKTDLKGTCTVLTVAHRLNTVVFYDQVLLLDRGAVLEHGPPLELLGREHGAFRKLAEESGDLAALAEAAREAAGAE